MSTSRKNFRILMMYPNVMLQNTIPINIALLSACLKQAGFESIRLFDTTLHRTQEISGDEIREKYLQLRKWDFSEVGLCLEEGNVCDDFEDLVRKYDPHLIATTMVENTWQQTISLLDRVKAIRPPTIVGGVTATFCPEDVLASDCVDMVCVGEGEQALVELCECLVKGEDHSRIQNLWVKTTSGCVKNSLRPLVDPDNQPFLDFSIFDNVRFYRPQRGRIVKMFPVETTRGCPYACTYCCASAWSEMFGAQFHRRRSMERVMAEIRYHRDTHDMEYVYFSSETFLAMPDRTFDEFLGQYSDIALPFWFQTRPETIREDRLLRMSHLDFRISMGIESGNENMRRNVLSRKVSNARILEATGILNTLGVRYSVNNMIGFPDETREQIFDTIELNRRCGVDDVNCFIFVPYRGTRLHEICVERGYISASHIADEHTMGSSLTMPQITAEEIYGLFRTFPLYVKLPKKVWPDIRRAETMDDEGQRIYGDLAETYRQKCGE